MPKRRLLSMSFWVLTKRNAPILYHPAKQLKQVIQYCGTNTIASDFKKNSLCCNAFCNIDETKKLHLLQPHKGAFCNFLSSSETNNSNKYAEEANGYYPLTSSALSLAHERLYAVSSSFSNSLVTFSRRESTTFIIDRYSGSRSMKVSALLRSF